MCSLCIRHVYLCIFYVYFMHKLCTLYVYFMYTCNIPHTGIHSTYAPSRSRNGWPPKPMSRLTGIWSRHVVQSGRQSAVSAPHCAVNDPDLAGQLFHSSGCNCKYQEFSIAVLIRVVLILGLAWASTSWEWRLLPYWYSRRYECILVIYRAALLATLVEHIL